MKTIDTAIKVGDKVRYVPHICHAHNCDANGNYPWVFGWQEHPKKEIEELKGARVRQVMGMIRRMANPSVGRRKLTLIRPAQTWNAVVRAVNEDGTVNLDIQSNQGGVILHYNNVKAQKYDEPHAHHSCFILPSDKASSETPVELASDETLSEPVSSAQEFDPENPTGF